MIPYEPKSSVDKISIDQARKYQQELLHVFKKRSYASLQLVEALAYSQKPTNVVELSQEIPFQRSYSVINKLLNEFGAESLVNIVETVDGKENTKIVRKKIDPVKFSKITKSYSSIFVNMLPEESNCNFRLFALDATPVPRVHAQTLDDRGYVYQANPVGKGLTIGSLASMLTYLPKEESKWSLPVSLERIPTDKTSCEIAKTQLQLLDELTPDGSLLSVIVADCAYGSLSPCSNQVVIARGRTDRIGRRLNKNEQINKKRGRPRKYEAEPIRFIDDHPPDSKSASDEEYEYEGPVKHQQGYIVFNRWNDVCVTGHSKPVDVVKVETFYKHNFDRTPLPPLLLILSGDRRKEITSLEAYKCYLRRFDIEHFFRFIKQKLLFCHYQTPDLDHQISWWWFCIITYWLLYLVRHIGTGPTRPWHKKRDPGQPAGPGEVKRQFASSIFPILGSPSRPPITSKKSRGRKLGTQLPKRERKKVVKKRRKRRKVDRFMPI